MAVRLAPTEALAGAKPEVSSLVIESGAGAMSRSVLL
jgi:hypothetical protein